MNLNQLYSSSCPDLLSNFSMLVQQSLLLPQSLTMPSVASFKHAKSPPIQQKHAPSFAFVTDPVKKVKYSEQNVQDYALKGYKEIQEVPLVISSKEYQSYGNKIEQAWLDENKQDLANYARNISNFPDLKQLSFNQQGLLNNGLNDPLFNLIKNENSLPRFPTASRVNENSPFMPLDPLELKKRQLEQQLFERQLAQQKAEQELQHKYLQALQQQQFEFFMQQQVVAQRTQQKVKAEPESLQDSASKLKMFDANISNPINFASSKPYTNIFANQSNSKESKPMFELPKFNMDSIPIIPVKTFKPSFPSKVQKMEAEDNYENIANNNDENLKQPKIIEVDNKDMRNNKIKKMKALQSTNKKRRQQNRPDLFDILNANAQIAKMEEPRRKNRWQLMSEDKDPNSVQNGEQTLQQMELTQTRKNRHDPFEVVNDENVDYGYLMSITITNNPGSTDSNNLPKEFVVISQGSDSGEEGKIREKKIHLGRAHQALIPVLDDRAISRRKTPNEVWNPEEMDQHEMEVYFEDLCKALKCEKINEEKALKLLKRKAYKKDKVLINISKNEKFYSSSLIVSTNINSDANENTNNNCI